MPRLFVLSGDDLGRAYDFDHAVVVGRGESADVRVRSTSVSRHHARVEPDPATGGWRVVDLDSRNGLVVGGRKVPAAPLSDGGVFVLGDLELRFRTEGAPAANAPIVLAPGADVERAGVPGHEAELAPETIVLPPRRTPSTVAARSAPEPVADGDEELELEGDWTDVVPPPPTGRAPSLADTRVASSPGGAAAPAQRERDARRAALLRGTSAGAPVKPAAGGTRPVLQYHRTEGPGGVLGADLAQQPWWVRAGVWLLGLGLLGGLAYGALELTRKLRAGEAALVAPDAAEDAPN